MPNDYQKKIFNQAKLKAVIQLFCSFRRGKDPKDPGHSLTTGQIAAYFDDEYLPLQPRSLLEVLRDAHIPHDSRNRFLTWQLYSHREPLDVLHVEYLREEGLDLSELRPNADVKAEEGESEAAGEPPQWWTVVEQQTGYNYCNCANCCMSSELPGLALPRVVTVAVVGRIAIGKLSRRP